MSEENKLPSAVDAQDTRTRKTVKLRSAAPITRDFPVSDPLTSRDTDTGNLEILDDTQTRKTLKLKPMVPGASAGPKLNIGSEDTNTRKTVILRPAAQVPPVNAAPAAPKPPVIPGGSAAPAPAVAPPVNPVAAPANPAPVNPVPAPAVAAPKVEVDDQTRAVPRPAVAASPKVEVDDQTRAVPRPAVAVAPKVEVDDQTRAVPRPMAAPGGVKLPASEDDASADQTVKMKRPPRLTPTPMAPGAQRPPVSGDAKATVKLAPPPSPAAPKPPVAPAAAPAPAPKPPVAPAAPAPAVAAPKPPTAAPKPPTAAPKPPTAAPKPPTAAPAAAPAPEKAPEAAPKADEDIALAPSKRKQEPAEGENAEKSSKAPVSRRINEEVENKPSLFYLIIAVATLLFVAAASVITTVHYLDFEHKIQIYDNVPGLPMAK